MKIPSKQELQQITINNSLAIQSIYKSLHKMYYKIILFF